MKKRFKLVLFISLMVVICSSSIIFALHNKFNESKTSNSLINIDSCSEEFMNDYFDKSSKISDKDNVLIVTSLDKISDDFGAVDIIEAPNNQYILQYFSKEEKNSALEKFTENDSIISVSENEISMIEETSYNSWGIEAMGLDYAINSIDGMELNEVTVAIIDTGCDMDLFNENYPGKITETYNVLNPSNTEMSDSHGHGTHVAGTIAEGTPSNVKILPIKASAGDGLLYNSDIISAINYITYYEKADVINMSFGGYYKDDGIYQALVAANSKNIISVAAAGNDNTTRAHYPSGFDNTISIAAIDSKLAKATFSNSGATVSFTAPGVNILSINGTMSGTSMATPHAASAVAILKSISKNISYNDTMELLKVNAVDLGTTGWDKYYGYGLISFTDAEFCNGIDCDEYGVFKDITDQITVSGFQVQNIIVLSNNYGSIANLMTTTVKINYIAGNYEIKKLKDLDGLEIIGYDAYNYEEQTVTLKYQGFETSFNITNSSARESAWAYEIIDEQNIKITGYQDNREELTTLYVPEKIDGYTVIEIDKSFANSFDKYYFKAVVLPSTITQIGEYAFQSFSNVEEIIGITGEVAIGQYAFRELSKLKIFEGAISSLGPYAFEQCGKLDNITLAPSITAIPNYAFASCDSLETINLPDSIETIGIAAFFNTFLNSVTIPKKVTKIEKHTFSGCYNLETLTLHENITEIGDRAFSNNNFKNLYIPASVTSIGQRVFEDNALETIVVDENNTVYDSRDNSSAIIETATNTLLVSSTTSVIPSSITIIGEYAFSKNFVLTEISIPNGIVEIQDSAFYDCDYLNNVILPRSVTTISDTAFDSISDLTLWVYSDSYAKTYAVAQSINYKTIDPYNVAVYLETRNYKAFETVNTDGLEVIVFYADAKTRTETIESGYTITYTGENTSFRYGDTYFTISATTATGESIEKQVSVTVTKATPNYTLPTNLTADTGKLLSTVELPTGFEWTDATQTIVEAGNVKYLAKYTPVDTLNYEIVSDIEITISVTETRTVITPNINVASKIYDGTNEINLDDITIVNLESTEYTIESAVLSAINIGSVNATIKIKLTDEKYKTHILENGVQEQEYVVLTTIHPVKVEKPKVVSKTYTYNGQSQSIELSGYDSKTMNISGNTMTDAGTQNVIVSLKDTNYTWNDDSTTDLVFTFKIEKASSNIVYSSVGNAVTYDGNMHSIILSVLSPTNATIRYKAEDGTYTLSEAPQYRDVGTYVISYKIYINTNYTEIFAKETLTITKETIINHSTDCETIYDGNPHSINIDVDIENYVIKYSIEDYEYNLTELPSFDEVGEYVVNYKITCETCNDMVGSNKVKIYGIEEIDSSLIVDDNIIISRENSFSALSNKISTFSISYLYIHYDGNKIFDTSDIIKTGDSIMININDVDSFEYYLAFLGDVNSDGKITSADYVKVRKHIMQTELITDKLHFYAADANADNKITSADYVKIKKYIMNGEGL